MCVAITTGHRYWLQRATLGYVAISGLEQKHTLGTTNAMSRRWLSLYCTHPLQLIVHESIKDAKLRSDKQRSLTIRAYGPGHTTGSLEAPLPLLSRATADCSLINPITSAKTGPLVATMMLSQKIHYISATRNAWILQPMTHEAALQQQNACASHVSQHRGR